MIEKVTSFFPGKKVGNDELAQIKEGWTPAKIFEKTGIKSRSVVTSEECASDLAFQAAQAMFLSENREEVDFLLFCTQSPDYILPSSACILQHRLGLQTNCGAFDFNLGCSGYIYGLALAESMISSGLAKTVLLLNGDTYSRYVHEEDLSTRTIFGDAGTASLIKKSSKHKLHSFVLGTDGSGADKLILRKGGSRASRATSDGGKADQLVCDRHNDRWIYMNGPEIFNFTLKTVPPLVSGVLDKSGLNQTEIDYYIFHQANRFILEHLRRKLQIPADRFCICLEDCGNTVSATIPIALESAIQSGRIQDGMKILLIGFGVGLSWGGCILEWNS